MAHIVGISGSLRRASFNTALLHAAAGLTPPGSTIEIRSIAPDANPYLALYAALRTGLEGPKSAENDSKRERTRFLPDNIYDAIRLFKNSEFMEELLGSEVHQRYIALKTMQADRCPRALGSRIKPSEVQFHHEVTNQYLWSQF